MNSNNKRRMLATAAASPVRYRKAIWVNIVVQIVFPIATVFTPAIAGKSNSTDYSLQIIEQPIKTQVYTLKAGETPATIALQYNISLGELQQLNVHRKLPRNFNQLSAGDTLDIPVTRKSLVDSSQNESDLKTAALASRAGNFLSNNPNSDAAISIANSLATAKASDEVQQWLNQFGTARVQLNVDNKFSLKNSQFDLLLPLLDRENNLLFTQGSFHRTDDRNQINLGFGLRHFEQSYMVGGNTFFDHDLSRSHSRMGMGLEYWRDYTKLAANAYLRQSGWKDSKDFDDYQERPANGWDLRAEAYLPSYPHLGGSLVYEQYYGDEVGLFGKDSLQKDPYAISTGVNYTPFPLLTVSAENRQGKSGENDTRLGLALTYELGSSWRKQLDPAAVAARRSLAGSRYDLIDRNNNIVLEYRKKETLHLQTANIISGYAGKKETLDVSVTAKNGLSRIDWDDSAILLHGGKIIHDGGEQYSVILPDYQSDENAINTYTISGVAYDNNGHASSPATTEINVTVAAVSVQGSRFTPEEFSLKADDQSTQILTLTLHDSDGQPIIGQAKDITLEIKADTGAKSDITTKVSEFTETSNGEYQVTVTAGTQIETLIFSPMIQEKVLSSSKGHIGAMPAINSLTLKGTLDVGENINGSYVFDANDSDPNDRSVFLWGYKGETAAQVNGGETVTTSGQVRPHTLAVSDAGKIIELSVQAKNGFNIEGNTLTADTSMPPGEGNEVDGGNNGSVINPVAVPSVDKLLLGGTLDVGQSLNGRYVFDSNNGDINDRSTFAWGYKGSTASVVDNGEVVTTPGEVASRELIAADAGQIIELSVQANNGLGVAGNTVTADTSMSGHNVDSGDNGAIINPQSQPSIDKLVISGTLDVGQSLQGSYAFNANNGDVNDHSTFAWGYQGATASAVGEGRVVISSGEVSPRELVVADTGQVIELSVQANNGLNVVGNTVTTDTTMSGNSVEGGDNGAIVNPLAGPSVSKLTLGGTLDVGKSLSGSYVFDANNGDANDHSTFAWGYLGATAGAVSDGRVVTTSGEVTPRELVVADAGQIIELSVQANNGLKVVGNTLTVDSSMNGQNIEGGDGGAVIDPVGAPSVDKLMISGTLDVGQSLQGSYKFAANSGDINDRSTFVWGNKGTTASDVESGDVVTSSGEVTPKTLTVADAGQVIELSVQANNGLNVAGNTLTVDTSMSDQNVDGGDNGAIINPQSQPSVDKLVISGTLDVGQSLQGSYAFNANNGDVNDHSTFAWGYQGATASAVGEGSVVTSSGEVSPRELVVADAGQVIELSVQANNGLNVVGNTVTTDTTMSGNSVEGGDNGAIVNPQAGPSVSKLTLGGTLDVGKSLSGSYVFDANNGDANDHSSFAWGYQGETASVVDNGDIVTTSGEVAPRELIIADAGQIIELSLQANNGLGITGNTATVDSSMSGQNIEGGDNGAVINPVAVPSIDKLVLSGTLNVGEDLQGSYTFDANNGDVNDRSTFAWGNKGTTAGGVENGDVVTTSGEVAPKTLAVADAGQVIELSVQANNDLNVVGNTMTSDTTMDGNSIEGGDNGTIVDPNAIPSVDKLVLSGTLEVGENLKGQYVFDTNNGDSTDSSTYAWGYQGETASVVDNGDTVTTSGEVASRELVLADVGQVIELSVQAKNNLNMVGNTITSDTSMSGNDIEGGDNGAIVDPMAEPVVSKLILSGKLGSGENLDGSYTFDANSGDANDRSTFVWGYQNETASEVDNGDVVTTSGKVTPRVLTVADIGQVIELSVQANNGLGVAGNIVTSDTTMSGNDTEGGDNGKIIDSSMAPKIDMLNLSGTLEVGEALQGNYAFDANGGDVTDRSTYAWGYKGGTAATVDKGDLVKTSGEVVPKTLVAADAGKIIELSVQANNALGVVGNTLTKDASMSSGNDLEGGNNGNVIDLMAAPAVTDLAIIGQLEVGESITGSYVFDPKFGSVEDNSIYLWGYEGKTSSSVASSTETITATGEIPSRELVLEDVGQIMELSVLAQNDLGVRGNTLTQSAKSEVVRVVELAVSADNEKQEKGGTINLTVTAKYKNTNVFASDEKINFALQSVVDRQNKDRTDSGKLVVGSTTIDKGYSAVTDKDGKVKVAITDPNGIGVKTTLAISVENGEKVATADVIFTVLTSPDTSKANMWGHMPERANRNAYDLLRPLLASEYSTSSSYQQANEDWAQYDATEANDFAKIHCGGSLPSINLLSSMMQGFPSNSLNKDFGWPTSKPYRSNSEGNYEGEYQVISYSTGGISNVKSGEKMFAGCALPKKEGVNAVMSKR